MADVFTKAERSEVMALIRGKRKPFYRMETAGKAYLGRHFGLETARL